MAGLPALVVLSLVIRQTDFHIEWIRYTYQATLMTLFFLLLLVYILARGYLIVECFINLRHLPAGVYDIPDWTAYFPHIG